MVTLPVTSFRPPPKLVKIELGRFWIKVTTRHADGPRQRSGLPERYLIHVRLQAPRTFTKACKRPRRLRLIIFNLGETPMVMQDTDTAVVPWMECSFPPKVVLFVPIRILVHSGEVHS